MNESCCGMIITSIRGISTGEHADMMAIIRDIRDGHHVLVRTLSPANQQ